MQLDALGRDAGVRAFSLHPGGIMTPLQRHLPTDEQVALGWIDESGTPLNPGGFKTPEAGAATQVWAATSPQLDGLGGLYLEDCDVAEIQPEAGTREGPARTGVRPTLWTRSRPPGCGRCRPS